MKSYGLIGYPLEHSFSKLFFDNKFKEQKIVDVNYDLIPLNDISLFSDILKTNKYSGFNVTIPYKQSIIKYIDVLNSVSKEINAVNTIKVENNKLYGFNTDIYGFEKSLLKILKPHHTDAMILGTGGSSMAIGYVLHKLNINTLFVSRNPKHLNQINYHQISEEVINKHTLIINCTPVGMYPNNLQCPSIPYQHLTKNHLLFDMIYNPELTLFLKNGKKQGAETQNGLSMLHIQAEKSWEIWNP